MLRAFVRKTILPFSVPVGSLSFVNCEGVTEIEGEPGDRADISSSGFSLPM